MNKKTLLLPLLALAGLGAAGYATDGFGLLSEAESEGLTLYGNVDVREVDLAFRVGGRIAAINAEEGDKVQAGALLATLESQSLDSRVEQADAQIAAAAAQLARARDGARAQEIQQAEARLRGAQAALANARADYNRQQPLVAPGAISRDQWDQTTTVLRQSEAQVAEAQAAVSLLRAGTRPEDIRAAEAQLSAARATRKGASIDSGDSRLFAPSSGTLITRAREPGAIVQPSETVLTLSIDRPMRVRAYVAEPDLSRVAPGMKVRVTADGNDKVYTGQIGYISPKAEFTPKTVETEDLRTDLVYQMRIIIANPDDGLRQGQPVTVRIDSARAKAR